MQIPIISGIFADATPEFRTSYPLNLVPIPKAQGISEGYLKPADGISTMGDGPGLCRGGIEWQGVCYRVMGTKLVRISSNGVTTVLGDVGGYRPVTMTYSFDRLAVASDGRLFYWNQANGLSEVTDIDLGTVKDIVWVDGYFMVTDGSSLVVTELNNPNQVDQLKYGSSEIDPDPIVALIKIRNEVHAVNRYTTEVFTNVGGVGFPFQRVSGAQIMRGAIGTHAATAFGESIAFIGSGKNEGIGVFIGAGGTSAKISTREIDQRLERYTDGQLSNVVIETMLDRNSETLLVHLPDGTLCYDAAATVAMQQPVWYELQSGVTEKEYRARYIVRCYNKWLVSDTVTPVFGYLDRTKHTHWGRTVVWEFGTPIVYNTSKGGIIRSIELVSLTGSGTFENTARITVEYSDDGVIWSQPKRVFAGRQGARLRPIKWQRLGMFRQRRMFRFRGDSTGVIAPARLEADIEALAW